MLLAAPTDKRGVPRGTCCSAVFSCRHAVTIQKLDEASWIIRIKHCTNTALPHQGSAELFVGTGEFYHGGNGWERGRRIFSR